MDELINWFDSERRLLPWRRSPTPYSVWVSEIMLQQTRVAVVIPYFERWMRRFPSVEALSQAPLDEVIKMWEGLGYYSRARNLHAGAQQVVNQYGGNLPKDEAALLSIKGIGRYTAGAIRAFAFHEQAAAVDGNVVRVMGRYWAIEEPLNSDRALRLLQRRIEEILPKERPWVASEALIELGATLCSAKSPRCGQCPLRKGCAAHALGRQGDFPLRAPRAKVTNLVRRVALIEYEGSLLVRCVPKGEVMHGLHHFPYAEEPTTLEDLFDILEVKPTEVKELTPVKHSFTRYRAHLFPLLFRLDRPVVVAGYFWAGSLMRDQLSFCSGHREILREFSACQ